MPRRADMRKQEVNLGEGGKCDKYRLARVPRRRKQAAVGPAKTIGDRAGKQSSFVPFVLLSKLSKARECGVDGSRCEASEVSEGSRRR